MTLLELLVEELPGRGGWPNWGILAVQDVDKWICFSTLPEVEINGGEWTNNGGEWVSCIKNGEHLAEDYSKAIITREQYEAALAASKSKWDGDGLPPVGVDVRVIPHNNHWGFSSVGEFSGKVLAFDGEDFWFKLTNGGKIASRTDKVDFRPIRTEQEEKKLSAIDSLVEFKISYHSHPKAAEEYLREMSSLYDAIAAGKIPHIRID